MEHSMEPDDQPREDAALEQPSERPRTPNQSESSGEENVLELLLGVVAEHDLSTGAEEPGPAQRAEGDGPGSSSSEECGSGECEEQAEATEEGAVPHEEAVPEVEAADASTGESSEANVEMALTKVTEGQEIASEEEEELAPLSSDEEATPAEITLPLDLASSESALPSIPFEAEESYSDSSRASESLSAQNSPDAHKASALTRQRSSSVEGPTLLGTSAIAARLLTEEKSAPQRRGRSTTSSQLERPEVAARGWNAILEEEKRENMSVVKSFGNYRIGEMLGKGGYGKVYQGLSATTGELVAVKEIIMRDREFVLEELPLILAEIKLHQSLNHPNIVRYIDFHRQGDKSLYIILELLEGGSLQDLLKRYSIFPEALVAQHAYQILLAIEYLHDQGILHRDIKGANVLLSKDGYCKLADFGLAMRLDVASLESATPLGTSYWMAPEIFCMESPTDISKASDIWSFGCTVMELLTGHPPYHHMTPVKAMFQILESDYPPLPPNASPDLRDFLRLCFHKDPKNRACVKELLRHKWILKHTARFRTRMSPLALSDITAQELLTFSDSSIKQLLEPSADEARHPLELSQEKRYEVLHSLRFKNRIMRETIKELLHRRQMLGNLDEKQFTRLLDAVRLLEKNFVSSDDKLAHLVYGDKLAINQFFSGNKGVLLTKKGTERKAKWHKRWILLKDNFLFLYESAEQNVEPVDVVLLSQPLKIVPAAERDVGKKFCFQVTTRGRSWYFAAANGQFMVKWLSDLSGIKNWYDDEVSTAAPLPQPLSPRRVMSLTHSRSEEKSFDSDVDSPPLSPHSSEDGTTARPGGPQRVSSAVLSSVASDGTIPVQRKTTQAQHPADLTQSMAGLVKKSDASEPLVIDLAALRKQREKDEKKRQKELRRTDGSQSARAKISASSTSPRSKSSDHSTNTLLKIATLSNSPSSDSVSSMDSPEIDAKAEKDRKWGREALKRALSMSEPNNRDSSPSKKKPSLKKELSAKRLSSMFRPRSRTSHPRVAMRDASSPQTSPRTGNEAVEKAASTMSSCDAERPDTEQRSALSTLKSSSQPVGHWLEQPAVAELEEQQLQVRIADEPATVLMPKKGSLHKTLDTSEDTLTSLTSSGNRVPVPALNAPNARREDDVSPDSPLSVDEEGDLEWAEPDLLDVLGQLMEQEERANAEAEATSRRIVERQNSETRAKNEPLANHGAGDFLPKQTAETLERENDMRAASDGEPTESTESTDGDSELDFEEQSCGIAVLPEDAEDSSDPEDARCEEDFECAEYAQEVEGPRTVGDEDQQQRELEESTDCDASMREVEPLPSTVQAEEERTA